MSQPTTECPLADNSVSKDYKAKFRTLSFNLRDNANPELRARVLRGELPPAQLVTLGPAELARKELSEWRQKRQEEAAKMVFLDAGVTPPQCTSSHVRVPGGRPAYAVQPDEALAARCCRVDTPACCCSTRVAILALAVRISMQIAAVRTLSSTA